MLKILKRTPKYYYTKRLSLLIGIHICLVKAEQLCNSALKLMNNDNDLTHAYGLYTFAIEEFGKLLYLQEFFQNNNDIQKFQSYIFKGNKSHHMKFKKGLKNLPPACKNITIYKQAAFPSGAAYTRKFGRGNLSFKFRSHSKISQFTSSRPNFDMRMNSFYVDWNVNEKTWDFNYKVVKKDLNKAIKEFKKHIPKYDLVMQKSKQEKIR